MAGPLLFTNPGDQLEVASSPRSDEICGVDIVVIKPSKTLRIESYDSNGTKCLTSRTAERIQPAAVRGYSMRIRMTLVCKKAYIATIRTARNEADEKLSV